MICEISHELLIHRRTGLLLGIRSGIDRILPASCVSDGIGIIIFVCSTSLAKYFYFIFYFKNKKKQQQKRQKAQKLITLKSPKITKIEVK